MRGYESRDRARAIAIALAVIALGAAAARAPVARAQPTPWSSAPDLDAAVADAIAAGRIPGCVVVIGARDGALYERAYGRRAILPTPEPMTESTVFDLASLSKAVATTTSVMELVDDGVVGLDDRVSRWVPEFTGDGRERVTVRQLLTHTSGLPAANPLREYSGGAGTALRTIFTTRLAAAPGARYVYSDLGFIVLGELVERAAHVDLARFAHERVFAPLAMNDTTFQPAAELRARAAPTEHRMLADGTRDTAFIRGVVHDPRAFRLGGVAGNAGVFSTGADLARFARAMLGRGALGDVRVLRPETLDAMLAPAAPESPGGPRHALGWLLADRTSPLSPHAYGHGGFTGTSLWIDPERDLFVLFLSNRVHPNGDASPAIGSLVRRIQALAVARRDRERRASAATSAGPGPVRPGIDVLRASAFALLRNAHVGLITNVAAVGTDGRTTSETLAHAPGVTLVALFSPEHGLGADRSGPVASTRDRATRVPVYSLFGPTRRPTAEMLAGVDTLVFDLPDVGTRFYTYVSTMRAAMEAAAEHHLRFVVLDRPNPLDGVAVEGPLLDSDIRSFVNQHPLPVRHGMTAGELARLFAAERAIDVRLEVVRIEGWRREMRFEETGLRWVAPSPSLPTARSALLSPAAGLLEGTNVSVGRGTQTPFELVGAPWIDGDALAARLSAATLPGVQVSAARFTPRAPPYRREPCSGVRITIDDPRAWRPVDVALELARALHALYPRAWRTTELVRLVGSRRVVDALLGGATLAQMRALWTDDLTAFMRRRAQYLLY